MSDTRRFMIASLAMGQSLLSAHYLRGARGAIPGEGPSVGREVNLKKDSRWDTLRVHTEPTPCKTARTLEVRERISVSSPLE